MSGAPLTAAELEQWLLFGGTVRPVSLTADRAVVDLCTCTGELVERRECDEPAVIDRVMREAAERA